MLSGVILAGGSGSRMGREKGLVNLGGRPMVASVADAVSRVADEVFLSVGMGRREAYSCLCDQKLRLVEDSASGRGPLEGLMNSFILAKGEYVIVSPCDTPFLRGEVLEMLRARATGSEGAVPVVRGYVEPLVAVYRKNSALMSFQEELAEGRGKVGDAVARLALNLVDERELKALDPELLSFWNVNTEEDLVRARKMMSRMSITR